ncbi:hypothetical protein F3682_17985 [Escherichia coli]|nr:hypothetical protein [Escherichia coli]
MFAGKKSAQIREILISESAWEEMTCLFAPSLTLPATPPSPVALAAGVRFIHKARLYEREIKDSLSPITRIVTVCAQRQDAQY